MQSGHNGCLHVSYKKETYNRQQHKTSTFSCNVCCIIGSVISATNVQRKVPDQRKLVFYDECCKCSGVGWGGVGGLVLQHSDSVMQRDAARTGERKVKLNQGG